MKLKPLLLTGSCLFFGLLASASAGTVQYVGSLTTSWTPYAGGAGLSLTPTAPAGISNSSPSYHYDRTTDPAGAITAGAWKPGDSYGMFFNGSVGNNVNLRMEFADAVNRHNGLTLSVLSGVSSDTIQAIGLFGGGTVTLFSGAVSGALTANLSFDIQPGGTTANILGNITDDTGTLWSSSTTPHTLNLGPDTNPIYAAFNQNQGTTTGINDMHWTYTAAPVPEPQTWAFLSMALVGFGLWRRSAARS